MKNFLTPGFIFALSACSFGTIGGTSRVKEIDSSSRRTVKTVMTCEQSENDLWTSVGIVKDSNSVFRALIIKNNDNDETKKIAGFISVRSATGGGGEVRYVNAKKGFQLIVKPAANFDGLVGELTLQADGPQEELIQQMSCFENNDISFDGEIPAFDAEFPRRP